MGKYETKSKPVWSHFYNAERQPVATVCYLDDERGTAVGLSICSPSDAPCKRVGRGISFQRARYAQHHYGGEGNIGWEGSRVGRFETLFVLLSTDFTYPLIPGFPEEVCKIAFVKEEGFRLTRVSRQESESGDSETPLLPDEVEVEQTC